MRAPEEGATHPELDVEDELATHTTSGPRAAPSQIDFLKRRFADSIPRGDDQGAELLRRLLDQLLNGPGR